jgi:CubicO group peptidase (beta-lactamase class C family)
MLNALPPTFAGLPTARPEDIGLSRPGLERLTEAFAREIVDRTPGAAMLVARHGKIGFLDTVGVQRPGGPAMPADAIFRIYSMTKPIVTVAAMMLVEEGRLLLNEPVSKFIPVFADVTVGVVDGDTITRVAPKRPITVQDLMRHTSGLTYAFTGGSPVQKLLAEARFASQDKTMAEHVEALAALPLKHQPGEAWEYSVSTDVLGRIVEIISGAKLSEVLRERIFAPLAMDDTGFFIPPEKLPRQAEPLSPDVYQSAGLAPHATTAPPKCEMGGGGLVSTIGDYARFLAMVSGGGALDGARILGPRTIAFMASDHLAPSVVKTHPMLWPGHGFGLGFAVRTDPGLAPATGSVGEYFWGGVAGTAFWISPRDSLFAILMLQTHPTLREPFRLWFRNLVNAAIL